jgi:hypothetical protein
MATAFDTQNELTLHGPGNNDALSYAYICKLERAVIQDARKSSSGLHFLTGSTPV